MSGKSLIEQRSRTAVFAAALAVVACAWGIAPVHAGALVENLVNSNGVAVMTNADSQDGKTHGAYTSSGIAPDLKGGAAYTIRSDVTKGDLTNISVTDVSISNYTTVVTVDAGANTNAYGPLMIYGDRDTEPDHTTALTGSQTISGLTLSGNTTYLNINSDAGNSSAFGGGARIGNLPNLVMSGGSVANNVLTINGADNTNHAAGGGMAIQSEWTSSTSISGMNFTGNLVSGNGGGLGTYARGGALFLQSTNDEARGDIPVGGNRGMTATISNLDFVDNTARSNGGGIAGGGAVAAEIAVRVSFDTVNFTGNTAETLGGVARGGAVKLNLYDVLGLPDQGDYPGSLEALGTRNGYEYYASFNNTTFTGNEAISNTVGTAEGGAIWTDKGILVSNSVFGVAGGDAGSNKAKGLRNAIHLGNDGVADADVIFNDAAGFKSSDYDGISGAGNIVKAGAGALDLFGDYSAFAGEYDFREGTVNFRSHTATQNGTVTATDAANAMYIESAAAVNLLDAATTVYVDDLHMDDSATYGVVVDRAGGVASKIVSNGDSEIGDIAVRVTGELVAGDSYTIVETSAAGGTLAYYGDVNRIVATALTQYSLAEVANNLVLTIDRRDRISSIGVTRNQRSVGEYLQGRPTHPLYDYVYQETDPERLRLALDTNSGDYYASTAASVVRYDRLGADMIIDRAQAVFFSDAPGSVSPGMTYAAAGRGLGVWAEVEGYQYRSDDGRNAGEGVTTGYGLAIGVDKLAGDWLFGAAFRYGDGRLEVDDRFAKTDMASYSGLLYAGRRACLGPGVLHVMGGLNGGFHQFDGRRDSIVGAERNRYTADYDGKSATAYLDAGMTFGDVSGFTFQPFGTAMWNGYWNDKIKEKGDPRYLLEGKSDENDWFSTTLGVRLTARVGEILAIDGVVGWRHTYGDVEPSASMKFRNDPVAGRFTVYGTPLKQNEGVLGAGLNLNLTENVNLRAGYDYTFGSGGAQSHEGRVNLGVMF